MKYILILLYLLSFQVHSQNNNDRYSNFIFKLDSLLKVQSEKPLGTYQSIKTINPEIIKYLNTAENIDQKRLILRKWYKVQQKFAWELNFQSHPVKCKDTTCLKFNVMNYGRVRTDYHKQFGFKITNMPCGDAPAYYIYVPSYELFKSLAEEFNDEEFLQLLYLLEYDNHLFLDRSFFKCLGVDKTCDLLLRYEEFISNFVGSEFSLLVWNNYSYLTSYFLSSNHFYDGMGYENELFLRAMNAYKKYLNNSNSVSYKHIVRTVFEQLRNIEKAYVQEKSMADKWVQVYKILNYGNH